MTGPTPPRRGRPLAWHLGALCAALLAPMLALEAFLLVQMAAAERARHEAGARDAARRVAVSLDRGLTALQAVLGVLATSDHLRAGDFASFHGRALDLARADGAEVVLRDRAGRTLASTGVPWGAPPPDDAHDPEADRAALETGRARVTDFLAGDGGRRPRFVVVAPAAGPGGERDFLLSLVVPVETLGKVLKRDDVPAGMVASVVDRRGAILARSAEPERFVGTSLASMAPARTETRP